MMNPNGATYVRVAQQAVGGADDTLVTLGLGSCVAIVLHDEAARVGGMAHILLPEPALSRDQGNASKFATTAVPALVPGGVLVMGKVETLIGEARLLFRPVNNRERIFRRPA